MDIFSFLIPAVLVAVFLVLCFGIYTLFRGGDFGRSWSPDRVLRIYQPPAQPAKALTSFEDFWQSMMSWPFGHPRAVATSKGELLVAWYAGVADVIGMNWALVALD